MSAPSASVSFSTLLVTSLRAVAVCARDRHQDARKSRHPAAILGRIVGAAEERAPVRREEHRQRPTAAPGDHLHRVHVDLVEVGPLFAINLYRDEIFVDQFRDRFVLERLALHHVTPMARRVADREHDRLVLRFRPRERIGSPRIPIDRVVRMLPQVRTLLVDQPIRLATVVTIRIAALTHLLSKLSCMPIHRDRRRGM